MEAQAADDRSTSSGEGSNISVSRHQSRLGLRPRNPEYREDSVDYPDDTESPSDDDSALWEVVDEGNASHSTPSLDDHNNPVIEPSSPRLKPLELNDELVLEPKTKRPSLPASRSSMALLPNGFLRPPPGLSSRQPIFDEQLPTVTLIPFGLDRDARAKLRAWQPKQVLNPHSDQLVVQPSTFLPSFYDYWAPGTPGRFGAEEAPFYNPYRINGIKSLRGIGRKMPLTFWRKIDPKTRVHIYDFEVNGRRSCLEIERENNRNSLQSCEPSHIKRLDEKWEVGVSGRRGGVLRGITGNAVPVKKMGRAFSKWGALKNFLTEDTPTQLPEKLLQNKRFFLFKRGDAMENIKGGILPIYRDQTGVYLLYPRAGRLPKWASEPTTLGARRVGATWFPTEDMQRSTSPKELPLSPNQEEQLCLEEGMEAASNGNEPVPSSEIPLSFKLSNAPSAEGKSSDDDHDSSDAETKGGVVESPTLRTSMSEDDLKSTHSSQKPVFDETALSDRFKDLSLDSDSEDNVSDNGTGEVDLGARAIRSPCPSPDLEHGDSVVKLPPGPSSEPELDDVKEHYSDEITGEESDTTPGKTQEEIGAFERKAQFEFRCRLAVMFGEPPPEDDEAESSVVITDAMEFLELIEKTENNNESNQKADLNSGIHGAIVEAKFGRRIAPIARRFRVIDSPMMRKDVLVRRAWEEFARQQLQSQEGFQNVELEI
ncbi:hypothetical protein FN846DRAFT_998044 [Sphaerosporella brunnea]|uniref:Uncharacterized protein n=1 Tax=Sphaerosporella brunnea TaxID=1250544 RepID=A0A5J5F6Y8_9PEZI|nr:hypothetical protein FN846DRAFT_998044 [Sphaerosporella brunnea]